MENLKQFRVWTGSVMEHDVTVGRFGVFYVNPGRKGDGLAEDDSASLTQMTTKYSDNTPVMQYIGVRDVAGIKCFEDDIIHIGSKVLRVGWCDMCGGYRGIDKHGITQANPYSEPFEVWGNIYQHTEITLS